MIVSGFTQKKGFPEVPTAEVEGQHSHCMQCCRVACSKFADQVTSCEMVTCELCGWRCHRCKQPEHSLVCPEERVVCVNKEYGCPHLVKRSRMARHLPVCPASVVCCSEEWSRWPMHAREKGVRMPLPQSKTYIDCGQLDVGLAMRDQRMLIDSLRAPKKLRRTLRNALTQKYPAAPFTSHGCSHESDVTASSDTSHTLSDDESDAPWDLTKSPPGLRESIKSKLFLVPKETTDSLAAALKQSAIGCSSSQDRLAYTSDAAGAAGAFDSFGYDNQNTQDLSYRSSSLPPGQTFTHHDAAVNSSGDTGIHIQSETLDAKTAQLVDNSRMCQSLESSENSNENNVSGSGPPGRSFTTPGHGSDLVLRHSAERSVRSSVSSDRASEVSQRSKSTLHDIGGTQLHKLLREENGNGTESDQEDVAEICLHKVLGVNIGFECINKYVSKSPSMYTFICAQNFRRDQFRWHFKNVHQEIHQGAQGWMEQRCPLAYMGCTFSFTRLEPSQPGMQVYHSWLQESFGLRSTTAALVDSTLTLAPRETAQCERDEASSPGPLTPESGSLCNKGAAGIQNRSCSDDGSAPSTDDTSGNSQSADAPSATGPSISDLANIDRDFDCLWKPGLNPAHTANSTSGSDDKAQDSEVEGSCNINSNNLLKTEESKPCLEASKSVCGPKLRMRVRPTIYTAMNYDSKVLFEYEVEEDEDEKQALSLSNLPFELLQNIAQHLDSLSLCNLALTSRLLRDVCCSLLDDHGIVLLNWQRHKSEGNITWRVANKRWMFSTSFEPIKSWRFRQDVPHMGDHLKVCPFNQDVLRHSAKFSLVQ